MKKELSQENPYRGNPINLAKAFVWQFFADATRSGTSISRVLDYGAFDGAMLDKILADNLIAEAFSVDVNKEKIQTRSSNAKHVLTAIRPGERLTHEDGYFDVVCLIGVLEHVVDQITLLTELKRVLKDSGTLIIAVPGKHWGSFLDLGNLKYSFPNIHKCYIYLRFGKRKYIERYVECENGLHGDIEFGKDYHEHFNSDDLKQLTDKVGLNIIDRDGYGLFFRVLHNVLYLMPFLKPVLWKLYLKDAIIFDKSELIFILKKSS